MSDINWSHFSAITTCPECKQKTTQLIREVVSQQGATCRACGAIYDLTSEDWSTMRNEMIELAEKIKTFSPRKGD